MSARSAHVPTFSFLPASLLELFGVRQTSRRSPSPYGGLYTRGPFAWPGKAPPFARHPALSLVLGSSLHIARK
eukprot:772213-Prorocentrum_lima.AAC.1